MHRSETTRSEDDASERFIKLDAHGASVNHPSATWQCVLDRKTALIWEVKTGRGLRHWKNTYTWYDPRSPLNGSTAGSRNGGHCVGSACDTASYIQTVNRSALCGFRNWRLPSREELRSLVDYGLRPPTPAIHDGYFPRTMPQFYWSATPDAGDADSAWGIGFTFGYDYSYFKSDFGYVRLVTEK